MAPGSRGNGRPDPFKPGPSAGTSGDEVECSLVVLAATAADSDVADEPGLDGEGIGAARWFEELPDELEYRDAVERGRAMLDG